jgi:hypothetical protein
MRITPSKKKRFLWVACAAAVATIVAVTIPRVVGAGPVMLADGQYPNGETPGTYQGPVARADCGPGSRPETGRYQGEVPVGDRDSGRSSQGYSCNLDLIGNYGPHSPQGFEGAEWQLARYKDCAYYSQRLANVGANGAHTTQERRGTIVVDVADPAHPKFATNLDTMGMLDPWETLKVNEKRGLLAAVNVMDGEGASFMGIYDIKQDCKHPRLLYDGPVTVLNHEGNFASDGRTYYSGGLQPGIISAIDVSDPTHPHLITTFFAKFGIHGMTTNQDGSRIFVSHINEDWPYTLPSSGRGDNRTIVGGNGMGIYDVSQIQNRTPNPQVRLVSALGWQDGQLGQMTLHIVRDGTPYAIEVDEAGHGGARVIDISAETAPKVVAKIRTEIMMPWNYNQAKSETSRPGKEDRGDLWFGYNFHYCNVDTQKDPTMLACSAFEQGLRVFDIRDLLHPKEIAYFNPGGDGTRQPGGWGGTYSGYPAAMPQFGPERHELWFTDQDRGLYVTRFTNGTWLSHATEATVSHGG